MLSVCLAVFNEEKQLSTCLESVKDFADEIVVVDGGSTDKTIEIAHLFGAKVIKTDNPPIFHINKQKALDACKGDWILQLDADEVVSKELAKEIVLVSQGKYSGVQDPKKKQLFDRHSALLQQRDGNVGTNSKETVAYFLPRLNYFLGGYLRHGGVYPDGVIRLVKKGFAHFPCKSVHEQIAVNGKVEWLEHDLLHFGDPQFTRYIERANRYTSLTATFLKEQGVRPSFFTFLKFAVVKPISIWFQLFVRHKGFLDGFPGFVFALFSGLHYTIAYMKLWELEHAR